MHGPRRRFSQADSPKTILDVGCGFGGTSRTLAKKYPEASIKAITISPEQQKRATELAVEQGVGNAEFMLMDALNMDFPDNSFDLVWACESGATSHGSPNLHHLPPISVWSS
eukprot:scaffold31961_cov32-Tisochrysis_lutea.AAC.3